MTAYDPDAASTEEEEEATTSAASAISKRPLPKQEQRVVTTRPNDVEEQPQELEADVVEMPKRRPRGRPKRVENQETPEVEDVRRPVIGRKRQPQREPAMPVLESMEEEDRFLGPEDIDLELIYKYGPMMKAYEEQRKKEKITWERLQNQMKKIKEGRESMVIVIKGESVEDELDLPVNDKAIHATEHELVHVIQPVVETELPPEQPPQVSHIDEYSRGLDDDPSQVVFIPRPHGNDKEAEINDEEGQKRKFFKRRRDMATRVGKDAEVKNIPVWKTPKGPKGIKIEGSHKREVTHISCKFCPRMFKDHCYLFRHVKAYHADHTKCRDYMNEIKPQMKVQCPICSKTISNIGNINNHMKQCHPEGDVSVQCDMCDKWYKTPASLKQHIRQRHGDNSKKIDCPQCDIKFTERRALKDHINCVHETTQVFTCSKCWKVFLTKSRLRRHMYIHGDHRHVCKQCGKGFHIKDNMNKHIRIVHERNDGKMWRCSYCSKEFLVKGNLTQHIRGIHLKQFPFTCSKCQQGFRRMKDMMIHMEKCTSEEQDNLEMFSSPTSVSRRGRGGGRPGGRAPRSSTPRVSRGGHIVGRVVEDNQLDMSVDEVGVHYDEDQDEEVMDDPTIEDSMEVARYMEGSQNYENGEEDEDDEDEEDDDGEVRGPHQEIVLTTSGTGDGAMEFQLEQDGMVIPIEVVIDQNEAETENNGAEVVAETVTAGTEQ